MEKSKITSIILTLSLALFILSASIAVPILFRQLYYGQIDKLNLTETTGYPQETIVEAFDEMMDYCTGGGEDAGMEFGTGELAWSKSGKEHFDDVEKLFGLDLLIMEITAVILLAFVLAKLFISGDDKQGKVSNLTGRLTNNAPGSLGEKGARFLHPERFLGRGPLFWGPALLLIVFGGLGLMASRNFESFFVKFHQMFFPGKTNWVFDENVDEIIRILPEEVFKYFAMVILIVLIVMCVVCIIADFIVARRSG